MKKMDNMTRKQKLFCNIVIALVYQFITIICGFVLPKFLIPHFGSKVNGLVNSITQFLGFITFLESGVGAVVQSSLYKPLANNDNEELSKVIISSRRFFNKIIKLMFVYILVLIFAYSYIVKDDFSFLYSAFLIIILSFNFLAQHYLFISYRLLLNADQLSFIQLSVHSICLVLNTVFTIILINLNVGIHGVKLISAIVFAMQPIVLKMIVDKKYKLNLKLDVFEEPIKQKWNGFAQHIASVILTNTDTVVLTLFSTLENVSIYGVYYLVVHGIKQIISSLTNGIQPLLGNMIAKKETNNLKDTFRSIELISNNVVLILYLIAGIMIIPFVRVYTQNFTDANYVSQNFGVLITIAYGFLSLRIPYENLVKAAGHYKETQKSSIIEALLNIVISIILVIKYGLVGVAIGTLVAMLYRTIYLVIYISKKILKISPNYFVKLMFENILVIIIVLLISQTNKLSALNYYSLIILAIKNSFICIIIVLLINLLFNRKELNRIKKSLIKSSKKGKK